MGIAGLRFSATGSLPFPIASRLSRMRASSPAPAIQSDTRQADIAPSTVNGDPLHPALAAALVYEQVQAVAVRVAAGVPERLHPCCR